MMVLEGVKARAIPATSIVLKMGGEFISLRDDLIKMFNKEICHFSSTCPVFKDFASAVKK